MEKKPKKLSQYRAPNGGFYEQNDIDYLLNSGYTEKDALNFLAESEKYRQKNENVSQKAQELLSRISNAKKDTAEETVPAEAVPAQPKVENL